MRDDKRFLPFFLREPVYVVPEPEKLAVESTVPPLPIAGLGKKGVLVLMHETEYPFLSPADQTFLDKILQAIDLSSDAIALVNWHSAQTGLQAGNVLDQYLPDQPYPTTLVFGEVPQPWSQGNFFEAYMVKSNEAQRFLQADSLATLAHDPVQKVRFWKCLQQLFLQP
ncbi:MAG: hypothetical protein WA960_12600 [Tunicatimonas sp.]